MMSSDPRLAAPCTRRQAHRVHRVHVHAEVVTELHGVEQRLRSLVVRLVDDPVDAGRRHQRRRAAERRDLGVGAVFAAADASRRDRRRRRPLQKRRLAGEVHPRESAR